MRMTPFVSVVIPTYNYADFLSQALDSLVKQTMSDWEAIVVDDGSTDATRDVVARFEDGRVQYIYQSNGGPSAARNRGLDLARGQYVALLDADDWLTPTSLADRVEFLACNSGYGAVYCDGYQCDVNGRVLRRLSSGMSSSRMGDIYPDLLRENFLGALSPVMVRAEVVRNLQLRFDESSIFVEDWDFLIRLAERVAFGFVDTTGVWYRLHERNRTPPVRDPRSLDSHARLFTKVVSSERFANVSTPTKLHVYKRLIPIYLAGQWEQQIAMLQSPRFLALPKAGQARILRLVASEYLAQDDRAEDVAELLKQARRVWPGDVRADLLALGAAVNPSATARLLDWWRARFSTV